MGTFNGTGKPSREIVENEQINKNIIINILNQLPAKFYEKRLNKKR